MKYNILSLSSSFRMFVFFSTCARIWLMVCSFIYRENFTQIKVVMSYL